MNFNRRRNIFTLGNYHLQSHPQHVVKVQPPSRRQNSDPFERDPFKIQSYNFRYADRPSFPIKSVVNNVNSTPPTNKHFETFFYNYDFANSRHNKEDSTTTKFHESRRRKCLQDLNTQSFNQTALPGRCSGSRQQTYGASGNSVNNTLPNAKPTNSLYLRSSSNREHLQGRSLSSTNAISAIQQQSGVRQQKSSSRSSLVRAESSNSRRLCNDRSSATPIGSKNLREIRSSSTRCSTSHSAHKPAQTIHVSTRNMESGAELGSKRSTASGCQININIKGLDDNPMGENVTIKIESDSKKGSATKLCASISSDNMNLNRNVRPKSASSSSKIVSSHRYENLNIRPRQSSEAFSIDKRISKYAVYERNKQAEREREAAVQRERAAIAQRDREKAVHRERERAVQRERERKKTNESNTSHAIQRAPLAARSLQTNSLLFKPVVMLSKDRVPSIVPWCLESDVRPCIIRDKENGGVPLFDVKHSTFKRLRETYNRGVADMQNLKSFKTHTEPVQQTYKSSSHRAPSAPMELHTHQSSRASERKLTNTASMHNHQRSMSRVSMQSGNGLQPLTSSSLLFHTKQSLTKQPLNVNINVYADKLKLLRV